jgi:hypothetical protein
MQMHELHGFKESLLMPKFKFATIMSMKCQSVKNLQKPIPLEKKTRQIGKIKGMIMHRILFMEWISFPVTHQVDLLVKIH